MISAVGLIDPSDPRYQSDKTCCKATCARIQESGRRKRPWGLLLETGSLARIRPAQDRLLSKSGSFIKTVVRESEPRMGKDGLMSITTEAVVNVKALQKIRSTRCRATSASTSFAASGEPKVSVQIALRDADQPDAPAAVFSGRRKYSQGAHQILRLSHLVRKPVPAPTESGKAADFAVIGGPRSRSFPCDYQPPA